MNTTLIQLSAKSLYSIIKIKVLPLLPISDVENASTSLIFKKLELKVQAMMGILKLSIKPNSPKV
jgi:hypothetical protein